MSGFVQGRNCLFKVNVLGSYLPLICAKSFSCEVTTDTVETTTQGSGPFKSFDYDSLSATLSFDGIQKIVDAASNPTLYDMLAAQLGFITMGFKMLFVDPDGLVKQLSGECLVSRTTLSAAINESAGGTLELQVSDDLILSTPTSSCDIDMTSFNIIGSTTTNIPSGGIHIVGDAGPFTIVPIYTGGPAARFDYQIDGGGYNTTFASTWIMNIVPGVHTINIIPYCDGNVSPGTFTSTISVVSPP